MNTLIQQMAEHMKDSGGSMRRFSFRLLACQASTMERAQQYQQAYNTWEMAGEIARNEHNRTWARARANFCLSMSKKCSAPDREPGTAATRRGR